MLAEPDSQYDVSREELVDQLADRLWGIFSDIELLYMTFTDAELQSVFNDSERRDGAIRAPVQHVLAFLYLGLQLTDDDVTHRLTSAITEAEAANDRDATVLLDIVTQPFLPPKQRIQALKNGNAEQVSIGALDRLWYDDQVPPEDVVAAFTALYDEELTVEDVETEREGAAMFERMPAPVVTNVEVSKEKPNSTDRS